MKTREELVSLGLDGFKVEEIMVLQSKMLEQAVKFQFRKKDGTIRNAIGTLKRALMKQSDGTMWEPKGEHKPEPTSVIRYFDLEKGMWRCFDCTAFIGAEV